MQFHQTAVLALASAVGFSAQGSGAEKTYYAYDIGHLPLGYNVYPAAINDKGQIVGQADAGTGRVAFISKPLGKGIRPIPSFAGDSYSSYAYAVNNRGEVVGMATAPNRGDMVAYVTAPDGGAMRAVADVPMEGLISAATGITEDGKVIGSVATHRANGAFFRAFMTDAGASTKRWIGTFSYNISVAAGVNERGQVTGTMMNVENGKYQPYITGPDGKGVQRLASLPGIWTFPSAINDHGRVAGNVNYTIETPDGNYTSYYPYVTASNGRRPAATDIHSLEFAYANTVDASGRLAGNYRDPSTSWSRAFVTDSEGDLVDLAALVTNLSSGTELQSVKGVNRHGQMAVQGWSATRGDVGFIVCPKVDCVVASADSQRLGSLAAGLPR